MQKMGADETLTSLVEILTDNLQELYEPLSRYGNADFVQGEKTAYVEFLELIRALWRDAAAHGLQEEIEKRFPL